MARGQLGYIICIQAFTACKSCNSSHKKHFPKFASACTQELCERRRVHAGGIISIYILKRLTTQICRVHPHIFSFALKRSQAPDFKKQLLRRLKGGDTTAATKAQAEEYASLMLQARLDLLTRLEASPASDLDIQVNQEIQVCCQEYPSLWNRASMHI